MRFLIIGQELSDFYTGSADTDPLTRLKGLIAESNVIVGCQANTPGNEGAYAELVKDRAPAVEAKPVWDYEFDKVRQLAVPIGPFFLFAKDNENASYPVPGRVSQLQPKADPHKVYRWAF